MSDKEDNNYIQYLVAIFFILSMLGAIIKGCNDATKDNPSPDPSDYEKLK